MSYLERAIKDGYANITGPEGKKKITYVKIFKTEFVYDRNFDSLVQLRHELTSYVNWFNTGRIHGSLNSM